MKKKGGKKESCRPEEHTHNTAMAIYYKKLYIKANMPATDRQTYETKGQTDRQTEYR